VSKVCRYCALGCRRTAGTDTSHGFLMTQLRPHVCRAKAEEADRCCSSSAHVLYNWLASCEQPNKAVMAPWFTGSASMAHMAQIETCELGEEHGVPQRAVCKTWSCHTPRLVLCL
jgi:hypothetical protein